MLLPKKSRNDVPITPAVNLNIPFATEDEYFNDKCHLKRIIITTISKKPASTCWKTRAHIPHPIYARTIAIIPAEKLLIKADNTILLNCSSRVPLALITDTIDLKKSKIVITLNTKQRSGLL